MHTTENGLVWCHWCKTALRCRVIRMQSECYDTGNQHPYREPLVVPQLYSKHPGKVCQHRPPPRYACRNTKAGSCWWLSNHLLVSRTCLIPPPTTHYHRLTLTPVFMAIIDYYHSNHHTNHNLLVCRAHTRRLSRRRQWIKLFLLWQRVWGLYPSNTRVDITAGTKLWKCARMVDFVVVGFVLLILYLFCM